MSEWPAYQTKLCHALSLSAELGKKNEQVVLHHEFFIFSPFFLLEIWCYVLQLWRWWYENLYFPSWGGKGKRQQVCVTQGALRKGGCTTETEESLHLWLLRKADSPMPWTVNLYLCKLNVKQHCLELVFCTVASAWSLQGEGEKDLEAVRSWMAVWVPFPGRWGVLAEALCIQCFAGCCWTSAEPYAALLFVFPSEDLLELILNSRGCGKWGGLQWGEVGWSSLLVPQYIAQARSPWPWVMSPSIFSPSKTIKQKDWRFKWLSWGCKGEV